MPLPPKNLPRHGPPVIPLPEPGSVGPHQPLGDGAPAPATPSGSTLTAPATETYGGSSIAFAIANAGSNRGISVSNAATSNGASALYGETYGGGAGLTGFNYGTSGPGGKFQVMSSQSDQAGAFATTVGTGPAVLGTVTSPTNGSPAVYGQNLEEFGIGVEGDGSNYGVVGESVAYGVFGHTSAGFGVSGISNSGYGILGLSSTGIGVYGLTNSSSAQAVEGHNTSNTNTQVAGNGSGVSGLSHSGPGAYGSSSSSYGVFGYDTTSVNNYSAAVLGNGSTDGVVGYSCCSSGGYAVIGRSESGNGVYAFGREIGLLAQGGGQYVGYFEGAVAAAEFEVVLAKNAPRNISAADGKLALAKIGALPVSTWDFKTDRMKRRHLGPMAQDFHAAFDPTGSDDKHIDLADLAGATLAAIKELHAEVAEKEAQIERLRARKNQRIAALQAQLDGFSRRVALIERGRVTAVRPVSSAVPP
jgi:hypothetical protein